MRSTLAVSLIAAQGLLLGACSTDSSTPMAPASSAASIPPVAAASWGPETPNFNLEVILRGDGFGHVKFRQPNDDAAIVFLDTWVRGLAPSTEYLLQRAVDPVVDDECTSTAWLTLGGGRAPKHHHRCDRDRPTGALPQPGGLSAWYRVRHPFSGRQRAHPGRRPAKRLLSVSHQPLRPQVRVPSVASFHRSGKCCPTFSGATPGTGCGRHVAPPSLAPSPDLHSEEAGRRVAAPFP